MDQTNSNNFQMQINAVSQSSQNDSNKIYRIYVVTWNVGSRFPDNISLRNLLALDKLAESNSDQKHLPDIYAIGLQEVNTQPQQQVIGLFKEDAWTLKTKDLLSRFDYVMVKTVQMQGLLLIMFVKRRHILYLSDIDSECTRTGFGGIWGNKGAVSIRFNFHGCAYTFINSHLAAHDHHLEERVNDFMQIVENHHYQVSDFPGIYDHDFVFWFGDLNFRLNGDDTAADICCKLNNASADKLIKLDQLYYIRRVTQEAFNKFDESQPKFPPTFKFIEGTTEYDLKRRPAWADRILFAVQPNKSQRDKRLSIEQITYASHPEYSISDHKPVSSQFKITSSLSPTKNNTIEFYPIAVWSIGEDNIIQYKKPPNFQEKNHDWIGVYPVNYTSLRDYKAYEYVNQAETPKPPMMSSSSNDPFFMSHSGHERIQRQQENDSEIVRLDFGGDIELINGEQYVLLYFQNTGIYGVSSIAGVSDKFTAKAKHECKE